MRLIKQVLCVHHRQLRLPSSKLCLSSTSRRYATHRDRDSSLSQSLDTRQQQPGDNQNTIGPFHVGVSRSSLRPNERVKKWSELSVGGKVQRTTARTTNLTVILFGAGLSAVLVYCLTSELFSKNSPTVLYNDACNRIKTSSQVARYLHGPLVFHNNAPSTVRPRHRSHTVNSQIMVDVNGREHMIINFYVQGSPPGYESTVPKSYVERMTTWTRDRVAILSELTWDETVSWTKHRASFLSEQAKRAFKYLSGKPMPASSGSDSISKVAEEIHHPERQSSASKLTGMFSSLRGSRHGPKKAQSEAEGRKFTDGEVHADLIRNNEGYFVFRYLLIDMPDSRSRNAVRIFVERGPGVLENEPVLRWNS